MRPSSAAVNEAPDKGQHAMNTSSLHTLSLRQNLLCLVACLAALSQGCGYRVLATSAPFGLTRMLVEPLSETSPLGLSPILTRELANRLANQGIHLVSQPAATHATLSGQITSTQTYPEPVAAIDSGVDRYRVAVTVRLALHDGAGKIVWTTTMKMTEDFGDGNGSATSPILATEASRRRALTRLSTRLAEALTEQLTISGTMHRTEAGQ